MDTATMPRCETCKHWECMATAPVYRFDYARLGTVLQDHGECQRAGEADYFSDGDLFSVWGDAHDVLKTRKDFGCVAHEPRTP